MPNLSHSNKGLLFDKVPLFYSKKKEILTLAYDFDSENMPSSEVIEWIQKAVKEFNRYGLAFLIYRRASTSHFSKNCFPNELILRKKHLNQVLFGVFNSSSKSLLATTATVKSLEEHLSYLKKQFNTTLDSWSSFARIDINIANPRFHQNPIGVLLHEIYHLFGVKDLAIFPLSCWKGIFYVNRTALYECEVTKAQALPYCSKLIFLNRRVETCDYFNAFNFTPLSLFSMHQYSYKTLEPFYLLNKSRISELLRAYQFPQALQNDYFLLLEKYQGANYFITYQDLLAVAHAIYSTAPGSLLGRLLHTPSFSIVPEHPIPWGDEQKFRRLIRFFKHAQKFNYPILAQEKKCFNVKVCACFAINVLEEFKVVDLTSRRLSCTFRKAVGFLGHLQLSSDCVLTGYSLMVGIYPLSIRFLTNATHVSSLLYLKVKKRSEFRTFFLANPDVKVGSQSTSFDLSRLCRVVSSSQRINLSCSSFHLPRGLELTKHCLLSRIVPTETYCFTVNFSDGFNSKACHLWFVGTNPLNVSALGAKLSHKELFLGPNLNQLAPLFYLLSDDDFKLTSVRPSLAGELGIIQRYIYQIGYFTIIPLCYGGFQASISKAGLSFRGQKIFRGMLVVLIVAIDYYINRSVPLLFFSKLGFSIVDKLSTQNRRLSRLLATFHLCVIVEWELRFSNLWAFMDQSSFWPELTDRLNKVILKILWVPMMIYIGHYFVLPEKLERGSSANRTREEANCSLLFQQKLRYSLFFEVGSLSLWGTLKNIKRSLCFKNIKRLPSLFFKQCFPLTDNNNPHEYDTSEICLH